MGLVCDGPGVFFDPPIERCMIHGDAALGHDLCEISVRNAKPNLEIDRVQDHRFRVMHAFETDHRLNPNIGFVKRTH